MKVITFILLTLVLLNVCFSFFIRLKLELLTIFPASNGEKIIIFMNTHININIFMKTKILYELINTKPDIILFCYYNYIFCASCFLLQII